MSMGFLEHFVYINTNLPRLNLYIPNYYAVGNTLSGARLGRPRNSVSDR